MRSKEREITDEKELNEIFNDSDVCRIGLLDGDVPYFVPMNFGYSEKENSIFFHSAKDGKKIDLLKMNNKVSFQIDTSHKLISSIIVCEFTMKYKSIVGVGIKSIVEDEKERIDGLNVIMKQYSGKDDLAFNEKAMKRTYILKLKILKRTGKQSI